MNTGPWTDAHQREAFVRLCELAIELVARDDSCKYQLAHAASCRNVNEYWFRVALGNAFCGARSSHATKLTSSSQ